MNTKTIFKSLLFLAIISIAIVSCKKDDDPEPSTGSGGGVNYTGSWKCNEVSSVNGSSVYNITITKSATDSTQLFFQNFYGLGTSTKATAVSNNTIFTFFPQVVAGNQLESGDGSILGNTINMTYVVNTGAYIDSCSATLIRQ